MITDEKYNRLLNEGLIMDHYMILCRMKAGQPIIRNPRVQGFVNLLTKKEYILEGALTEKALLLVEDDVPLVQKSTTGDRKVVVKDWALGLHKRLEEKLLKSTGQRQVRAKISKKSYPFLPNYVDLTKNLEKVITIYRIKDLDKIERALTAHIDRCVKSDDWFPLMIYYIFKEGKSQMVTDMENLEDNVVVNKGVINPEELF
jgi:hypothetical protein